MRQNILQTSYLIQGPTVISGPIVILLMDKILHHQGWWLSHYLSSWDNLSWKGLKGMAQGFPGFVSMGTRKIHHWQFKLQNKKACMIIIDTSWVTQFITWCQQKITKRQHLLIIHHSYLNRDMSSYRGTGNYRMLTSPQNYILLPCPTIHQI